MSTYFHNDRQQRAMGLGVDARSVAERGFRKAAEEFPQTLEDLAEEINNQHLEYPNAKPHT